jgi:amino acid adenylation domain-containing protein/non-ribosomal peptide synthase protein (TIGR01720 family)
MNKRLDPHAEQLLRVSERFAALSPEAQKSFLQELVKNGIDFGKLPIVRTGRHAVPASSAQRALWFHKDSALYNLPAAARLRGRLNKKVLVRSFEDLIERHEALRTTFRQDGSSILQVVHDSSPLHLQETALAAGSERERELQLEAEINREAREPFDLEAGPLLRVGLIEIAAEDHVLLVTMHHAVSDAVSIRILIGEFAHFYERHWRGEASDLPELRVQYADYATWQQTWLQAGGARPHLAYWRERLSGDTPSLALSSRLHPAARSGRGERRVFRLEDRLGQALRALAGACDATLFMVLLAAFKILLYRTTGEADIRVGVPVANRNREETRGVIGFFVNTHVLQSHVDGRNSFTEVLAEVKAAAMGAQAYQDLPYEQLVEALRGGAEPLFDVLYNHLRHETEALASLPDLEVEVLRADAVSAKFDLALDTVEEADGGLSAAFTFATELFEAGEIDALGRRFLAALEAVAAKPSVRVADIALLESDERLLFRSIWARSAEGCVGDRRLVPELLAAVAAGAGEKIAVVCGEQRLSYAALELRASRLACVLAGAGVGPEVLVGVALERSVDLIVALVAVMKAGGAYVPLDVDYPRERLAYLMRDAEIGLLLTETGVAERLPAEAGVDVGLRRLLLDGLDLDAGTGDGLPASVVVSGPSHEDQLAYVIYTSGSTGEPKGVGVAHGPLARHCLAIAEAYGMTAGGSLDPDGGRQVCELHFMSFAFDGAHERWLTTLLCGGRLVLRGASLWTPAETYEVLRSEAVDIACFPPAYLQHLADYARCRQQADGESPPRVSIYTFGGDVVTRANYDLVREHLRPVSLINGYGPTETVVTPLLWKAAAAADCGGATVPIGHPVGGRRAFIFDVDLNLVPPGCAGELYLGGDGAGRSYLARGYLGRPGLTAERFVPDPLSGVPGGRLYRSGDLARLRADGTVECLGRADRQVKIRGFRIELGEIEARLSALPGVAAAAAHVFESGAGKRLVGYVVASGSASHERLDTEAMRSRLKQEVPDYLVPWRIVELSALPLTPNGKLDRAQLPPPGPQDAPLTAPHTELEHRIAQIWKDVLQTQDIGTNTNFFNAGGDSILSLRVIAEIRNAPDIDIEVGLRDLMRFQTIGELVAQRANAIPGEKTPVRAAPIVLEEGEFGLLPIQHWFFEAAMKEPDHFNQSLLLNAPNDLDAGLLDAALRLVALHHDALRLRFRRGADGLWRQFYVPVESLSSSWEKDPPLWIRDAVSAGDVEVIANAAQRSLDLVQGPTFRAAMIQMTDGGRRLFIVLHHLIIDGVSWRILLDDLQTAYRQLQASGAWKAPAKSSSYRQWAERLAIEARSPALLEELPFWRGMLEDASGPELPRDNPRGRPLVKFGKSVSIRLDRETTQDLLKVAPEAYRTQVNDLLLAGLAAAICRWSGQDSALIQLEGHGREDLFADLDLSRTLGWFTTAFPVRLTPHVEAGMETLVNAVKTQLQRLPNRGIGYGLLRYLAEEAIRQELAALPQPRVTFNYLGQFDQSFSSSIFAPAKETSGDAYSPEAPLANWLEIIGGVYAGELSFRCVFSHQVYRPETIERLMSGYRAELEALVVHCRHVLGARRDAEGLVGV